MSLSSGVLNDVILPRRVDFYFVDLLNMLGCWFVLMLFSYIWAPPHFGSFEPFVLLSKRV